MMIQFIEECDALTKPPEPEGGAEAPAAMPGMPPGPGMPPPGPPMPGGEIPGGPPMPGGGPPPQLPI